MIAPDPIRASDAVAGTGDPAFATRQSARARQILHRAGMAVGALLLILLAGCTAAARAPATGPAVDSLSVGIYPYVPRLEQFKTAIRTAWGERHPDVALKFASDKQWDGGYDTDPGDLDVFVFDAILLDYFVAQGFLAAIQPDEVEDPEDYLAYALKGSRVDGTLYGLPQLGCADILFFRRGDRELAAADTLGEVLAALGECSYSEQIPPPGVGLMVDLAGGTTAACRYLDAVEDIYGLYTDDPPLAPSDDKIDSWAVANLQRVLRMASLANARYEGAAYQRGKWFGEGRGRAVIGFTELMSEIGDATRAELEFKPMPLSDRDGVSLFYADVAGINSRVGAKRALALELANLMTSTAVMLASIGPTPQADSSQYLMPVRHSILHRLAEDDPLYARMQQLVEQSSPRLFRIGPASRDWLKTRKKTIRQRIHDGACPTAAAGVESP